MKEQLKEVRYIPLDDVFIKRNENDKESMVLRGYVVKFNERSVLLCDEFYERVSPGAFAKSLEANVIKALWNHNSDIILGSTKSRTLSLEEDDIGLKFELQLPNTNNAKDIYESITRGDVYGVSFGFYVKKENWEYLKEEDVYERNLLEIELLEISPTAFPAYPTSEVGKRSMERESIKTRIERKNDKLLREKLKAKIELLKI